MGVTHNHNPPWLNHTLVAMSTAMLASSSQAKYTTAPRPSSGSILDSPPAPAVRLA